MRVKRQPSHPPPPPAHAAPQKTRSPPRVRRGSAHAYRSSSYSHPNGRSFATAQGVAQVGRKGNRLGQPFQPVRLPEYSHTGRSLSCSMKFFDGLQWHDHATIQRPENVQAAGSNCQPYLWGRVGDDCPVRVRHWQGPKATRLRSSRSQPRRNAPMSRATECFSMNSLMSRRTMCSWESNRNSARALHSSVLPTPVGPRKRKLP